MAKIIFYLTTCGIPVLIVIALLIVIGDAVS
jgi:hypothetical protein